MYSLVGVQPIISLTAELIGTPTSWTVTYTPGFKIDQCKSTSLIMSLIAFQGPGSHVCTQGEEWFEYSVAKSRYFLSFEGDGALEYFLGIPS
jgi:hypothetical protein